MNYSTDERMMDPVATALQSRRLVSTYTRLFDEDGMPRDLPPSISHLYRNVLPESTQDWLNSYQPPPPSSSSSSSAASLNVSSSNPLSLLNYACRKELIGKPRIPLTKQQLDNEFTLFPNEPSSSSSSSSAMVTDDTRTMDTSSSSSKLVLKLGGTKNDPDTVATTTLVSSVSTVSPSSSSSSSSSVTSLNYTAILQIEDEVIQLLASNELNKAIQQEIMERFQAEILHHSLNQLRNLRWDNWPDGNPFTVKLTKSYVTKAGIGNYFDHIKIPMDLTTMQEKLQNRKYKSPDVFFNDVNLIIYNAKLFNGPHYPQPVFPDPSSSTITDTKKYGPLSVYGMAFDMERKLQDMKPRIEACYTQLQRIVPRKIIAGMNLGGGNDLLRKYYSKDFQESLVKATKLWAETHGINLVK